VITVILGLALAALGGVALELWARWWILHRTRYHVWAPGLRIELHQSRDVFPQVEPVVRFAVNADGERGGVLPRDDAGLYRVLIAGGSAAECFALDQGTSWPGTVERLLSSPESLRTLGARGVHVGNIGRSGIASSELDVIFEHVLPQYSRPPLSVIVIMVGASDVLKWIEEGAPPSSPARASTPAEIFACHPGERFGWKPAQWGAMALVRRLRRAWLRPLEVREGAGAWVPVARKMRAQAQELRTSVPDPAVMLDAFDRHFRRLLKRAAAHGERVLVVRQPWFDKDWTARAASMFWHGGVGKAWKQTISAFYTLEVLGRLMDLLDGRAAAAAEEVGVEQLDVRPVLTPNLENYYDFFHYTPAGAAIVARAVAGAVLRQPALRRSAVASPAPVPVASAVTSRHW
jgi:lysophospholipase L1-like esterase